MRGGLWPAITRRESPPSPLPRLPTLAAGECGLSLGARDPETRQHCLSGHYLEAPTGSDAATLAVRSTSLHEYPHSLSYQPKTFAPRPFAIVSSLSKMHEYG